MGGRTRLQGHNCFYLKNERTCKEWFVIREVLDDLSRTKILDEPRPCVWDPNKMLCGMQQFHCAAYASPPPPPGGVGSLSVVAPMPPAASPLAVQLGSAEGMDKANVPSTAQSESEWSAFLGKAGSRAWKLFMVNPAGVLVSCAALLSVAALVLWGICCYSSEVHLSDRLPSHLLSIDREDRSSRGRGKRGKKSRRNRRERINRDYEEEDMLPVHEVELDDYPEDEDDEERLRNGPMGRDPSSRRGRSSRASSSASVRRSLD